MKNILIIGIDSTIGKYLSKRLDPEKFSIYGTSRNLKLIDNKKFFYLDLSHPDLKFTNTIRFDFVIFCASITKIEMCCRNQEFCHHINVDSQIIIASTLITQSNPYIIFLSSNAVFDGSKPFVLEDSKKNPINYYGVVKAEAEDILSQLTKKLIIIRATKVFHKEHPLLCEWVSRLKKKEAIVAFSDVSVCPISIELIFITILRLIQKEKLGIFHLSGKYDLTYYELAQYIANKVSPNENTVLAQKGLGNILFENQAPKYTSLDMKNSIENLQIYPQSIIELFDFL